MTYGRERPFRREVFRVEWPGPLASTRNPKSVQGRSELGRYALFGGRGDVTSTQG